MRRPSSNLERDESVSAKWQQLRQYEEQDMGDMGQADIVNSHQPQQQQQQEGGLKQKQTARGKLEQFKKNSAKRFSTIKSQIYGRYKKSDSNGRKESDTGVAKTEVCRSPAGEEGNNKNGCAPNSSHVLPRLNGLKSSKSLQNLEQITRDSIRSVADKTSYIGQNLKHRYGSRVELNRLTPKRFYEEFNDDVDSDEEDVRKGRSDEVF